MPAKLVPRLRSGAGIPQGSEGVPLTRTQQVTREGVLAPLYGGVEAGGHKFVCAVGSGPDDLRDEAVIPTTSPGETIARVVDFFRKTPDFARVAAFGIGSFGPVDIHAGSPTFGHITSTPKPGWADTDLVRPSRTRVRAPGSVRHRR